jgi:hypothetical protein
MLKSNYNFLKPSLKLEIAMNQKYAWNFGIQYETYKYEIPYEYRIKVPGSNVNFINFNTDTRMNLLTYAIELRSYNTRKGYMAPYGRYLMYGLSVFKASHSINGASTTIQNPLNDEIEIKINEQSFNAKPEIGLRFGMGKKRYLDKKSKQFLEFQFFFDLQLYGYGSVEGNRYDAPFESPKNIAHSTGMALNQSNSIFLLKFAYGFSL